MRNQQQHIILYQIILRTPLQNGYDLELKGFLNNPVFQNNKFLKRIRIPIVV